MDVGVRLEGAHGGDDGGGIDAAGEGSTDGDIAAEVETDAVDEAVTEACGGFFEGDLAGFLELDGPVGNRGAGGGVVEGDL